MKLLVDECLSPRLAKLAHELGFPESSHVSWIGKAGVKDWALLPTIVAGNWTFVTRNADDFRGPPGAPGTKGEYRKLSLHAGLICLNGPVGMDLAMQVALFEAALEQLATDSDLVNRVLEVTLEDPTDALFRIVRYALPED
jgi:hypothetical protein